MSGFDHWLDTVLPAEMILGRTAVPTFLICGLFGVAAGTMTVITLVAVRGANLWVAMGMIGVACTTFIAMSLLHQQVRGWEEHVHLRDTYAVLAVASLLLWATGNPVLLYLDSLAVGLSVFMIFGRVGCTAAGCCYGAPASIGILYPRHGCGDAERVRRFPVQPIEAAAWIGVAAAGALVTIVGGPGQATGVTLVLCGITRICTDSVRVDPRPHWWGISEARLLSLLGIALGVVLYQHPNEWTPSSMSFGAIGLLAGALLYLGRHRWLTLPPPLPERLPEHAAQIAEAIVGVDACSDRAVAPQKVRTFAIDDIRIGVSQEVTASLLHIVLSVSRSDSKGRLSPAEAEYVLGLIAGAIGSPAAKTSAVVQSKPGLFLTQITRPRAAPADQALDPSHDIPASPSAQAPSSPGNARPLHEQLPRPGTPYEPAQALADDYFAPLPSQQELESGATR
jgi:hypothetical protein